MADTDIVAAVRRAAAIVGASIDVSIAPAHRKIHRADARLLRVLAEWIESHPDRKLIGQQVTFEAADQEREGKS